MRLILVFLHLLVGTQITGATEIYESIKPLEKPTIQNARKVIVELETLEKSADKESKHLASIIRFSVKDLFTAEFNIYEARKHQLQSEKTAQLRDKAAKEWMKPNTLTGKVNLIAVDQCLEEAYGYREGAARRIGDAESNWIDSVQRFNAILPDLQKLDDSRVIDIMVDTLGDLTKRVSGKNGYRPKLPPRRKRVSSAKRKYKSILRASPSSYTKYYAPTTGEHWVKGYYRSDGTYVKGHYKTNPDSCFWNNWSSLGNRNPHTGKLGTKRPDKSLPSHYAKGFTSGYGSSSSSGTVTVRGHYRNGKWVRSYTRRK